MSFRQMYEEKYMRFPCGKAKALSFSYDDGVAADKKLVKILNKYGLKATFNLNNLLFDCENWHGRMDERETFETFSGGAHEIAVHGARERRKTYGLQPAAKFTVIARRTTVWFFRWTAKGYTIRRAFPYGWKYAEWCMKFPRAARLFLKKIKRIYNISN